MKRPCIQAAAVMLILAMLIFIGCDHKKKAGVTHFSDSDAGPFLQVRNIREASAQVVDWAKAVFAIQTESGFRGTGFYISSDGLFVTSTQALGPRDCFAEGCQITLLENYQLDSEPIARQVFAKPIGVSQNQMLALFQATDSKSKLPSPNFLPIANGRPALDQGLTMIGSPIVALKRYVNGKVLNVFSSGLQTDNVVFEGNEGSPLVDANGAVVAVSSFNLLDRRSKVQRDGNLASLSHADFVPVEFVSAVKGDLSLLASDRKARFQSASSDNADLRFFRLRRHPGRTQNHSHSGVARLESSCEMSAHTDDPTVREVLVKNCGELITWLECRKENLLQDFTYCPGADESFRLTQLFENLPHVESAQSDNLRLRLRLAIKLSPSILDGRQRAWAELNQWLKQPDSKYSPAVAELAAELAPQVQEPLFRDIDLKSYLLNYPSIEGHNTQYDYIVKGLLALYEQNRVAKDEMESATNEILHARDISIEQLFEVQDAIYRHNFKLQEEL